MRHIKFTHTDYGYACTSQSDENIGILGIFFASEIGCPATTWDNWIFDNREEEEEIGGNVTYLEKEGPDIYISFLYDNDDDDSQAPEDQSNKLKISRSNLLQLILDWKEKVCKEKPKEVTITYDNDTFTLTTSN